MSDYPEIGVMPWREWVLDVACYILPQADWGKQRWRQLVRQIRKPPLSTNPWRRLFARYSMTPGEAIYTMQKVEPEYVSYTFALGAQPTASKTAK